MRIVPTSVIKDGGEVYQPDVEYDVDDEVGRRFVTQGWATSPDHATNGEPGDTTVNMAPNSVRHTTAGTED